jgi:hypothetical protein
MITREIPRDLKDPRPFLAVGRVRRIERAKKGLLRQILGRAALSDETAKKPEDRFPVTNKELMDLVAIHLVLRTRLPGGEARCHL